MVETAAHLTDHVFPRLPVRQWVLSVPKRLRYFMQPRLALPKKRKVGKSLGKSRATGPAQAQALTQTQPGCL